MVGENSLIVQRTCLDFSSDLYGHLSKVYAGIRDDNPSFADAREHHEQAEIILTSIRSLTHNKKLIRPLEQDLAIAKIEIDKVEREYAA